jgi:hypothetical protein
MRNSSKDLNTVFRKKKKNKKERLEHFLCSTKHAIIWALFFNFIHFMWIAAAQILALSPLTFSERWAVVSCLNTLLTVRSP